ncbi:MAG: hypothetical protein M3463_13375 [Verrucomicrobiota bacterium]|nr:hypothetical protein [Verrucomicrobiota bacterium]
MATRSTKQRSRRRKQATKVLFVCSRNRRRSLTAEKLLEGLPGYQARSAGTQPEARIAVTEGHIGWADLIFVMEKAHLARLRRRFAEALEGKHVIVLQIPDDFEFMDADLMDELRARLAPYLELPEESALATGIRPLARRIEQSGEQCRAQVREPIPSLVEKIVAGGQTGADRAALDWAMEHGVPHGGWCPKGRKAEDGIVHTRYQLRETRGVACATRTKWNVRDSDGTVILSTRRKLTGGSLETARAAKALGKACLHIAPATADPAVTLREFIVEHGIKTLNVAGPRASEDPEVYELVKTVLQRALG